MGECSSTWGFVVTVTRNACFRVTGTFPVCSTRQGAYSRFSGRLEFIRGGRIPRVSWKLVSLCIHVAICSC
jgi:hypothetical protein